MNEDYLAELFLIFVEVHAFWSIVVNVVGMFSVLTSSFGSTR